MATEEAYLPPEIMVKILSPLPTKSLLRFKVVCKPWSALISSHSFIRVHLRHSNASTSSNAIFDKNLFLVLHQDGQYHAYVAPANVKNEILCSSNGLLLLRGNSRLDLVLWNPSMRKSNKVRLPFRFNEPWLHILCYDPGTADLKIVVACWHNYAVYSYKNQYWIKYRGIGIDPVMSSRDEVFVDGAVYWIGRGNKLVCFESDGDRLMMVERPGDLTQEDEFRLIGLRDRLCVWFCRVVESVVRVWMREVGDVWSEFMRIENVPYPCSNLRPFYLGEDEIMFYLKAQQRVMVYSPLLKTFEEFDCPTLLPTQHADAAFNSFHRLICVDSLLFFDPQLPRRSHRKRRRQLDIS